MKKERITILLMRNKIFYANINEILFIKAYGSLCDIYLVGGKKLRSRKSFKDYDPIVKDAGNFITIFKGCTIQGKYAKFLKVNQNLLKMEGYEDLLNVARDRMKEVKRFLDSL